MAQALPARPNLVWLKKAAKERLAKLRERDSAARLFQAQLALAREYGFASWRALKTEVEARDPAHAAVAPVFAAARRGDLDAVRRALDSGFDPVTPDAEGFTLHQIAKEHRHDAIEILVRTTLERETRSPEIVAAIKGILRAAQDGAVEELRRRIEAAPELIDALGGGGHQKATALHLAALHNRHEAVRLLLDAGADPSATDASGATPLTTASQDGADREIIDALLAAGAPLDFLTAVNLGRLDDAEAMLRDDPACVGPAGADTIALHLAVSRRKLATIRWLIAHGVDVNAKREMWGCNSTALHMTVESGALDIAHLLLDAGADPNIRDDKYDATALGWAEFFGRQDFAALIKERGGSS